MSILNKHAMEVLISNSKNKLRLRQAFTDVGVTLTDKLTARTKLIVPTVDEELPFLSRAKEHLENWGTKIMVAYSDTIDTCRDKAEFYRFCRRHDFNVPATMQDNLILKPRFGKGSKGITRIDKSYIVQEFIDWPEYSIDYFADFDGKCLSAIPRKRLGIVNGESTKAEICMDDVLVNLSVRLGTELRLIGHNTIQCFYQDNRVIFNEINCRFGGGFWLTQHLYPTVKKLVELCV